MKLLSVFVLLCALCHLAKGLATAVLTPEEEKDSLVRAKALEEIEEIIEEEIAYNLIEKHLGETPEYVAESCKQIGEVKPYADSGYYWIRRPSGPTGVYCELDGAFNKEGGWMRVAHIDMQDPNIKCPSGLEELVIEQKRLCQRPSDKIPGCSSTNFLVHDIDYSKICGKVIGYQYFNTWGFGPNRFNTDGIDGVYLDGVSITHGSPRNHVWSFASAPDTMNYHYEHVQCPCLTGPNTTNFTGIIPPFVGDHYYCETGSGAALRQRKYYFEDPLWNGEGCKGEGDNQCCQRGGPWFCADLNTTTIDAVELRLCTNSPLSNENVVLEKIELYMQ